MFKFRRTKLDSEHHLARPARSWLLAQITTTGRSSTSGVFCLVEPLLKAKGCLFLKSLMKCWLQGNIYISFVATRIKKLRLRARRKAKYDTTEIIFVLHFLPCPSKDWASLSQINYIKHWIFKGFGSLLSSKKERKAATWQKHAQKQRRGFLPAFTYRCYHHTYQ